MTLNKLSKIQSASVKVVTLPAITTALRASGDIGERDVVQVQIRKVRAAQVVADTGATPLMLAVLKERQKGESPEAFRDRLRNRMEDDPQVIQDTQRQILATQESVVIHGVVAISIHEEGTRPEWDELTLERNGPQSLNILGDDLDVVHDQIVAFSNLPYQRLGGAGAVTFPAEQAGADHQPSGGVLRDDAEPVPEPPAG